MGWQQVADAPGLPAHGIVASEVSSILIDLRELFLNLVVCLEHTTVPTTCRKLVHTFHHSLSSLSLSPSLNQMAEELCIKVLIAFGADVNAKNEYNMTPLDMACKNQVHSMFV